MTTEAVWNEYAQDILVYFKTKVGDAAIAEDLRQDVFLKIHQKLDTLKASDKVHHWLSVIARNRLVDYYKSKSRRIDEKELQFEFESEAFFTKAANKCLVSMLKSLPKEYADPIRMSDLEGIKQKEVADTLGISLSGAKSRIQRGRVMLKDAISECCRVELNQRNELVGADCQNEDCACDE